MSDSEAVKRMFDECLELVKKSAERPVMLARIMAIDRFRLSKGQQANERLRTRIAELETICGGLTRLYADTLAVRGLLEKLEARFASEGQEGDRG